MSAAASSVIHEPRPFESPGAWSIAATALLLAVVSFVVFFQAPVSHAGGDSIWVLHTSASLITNQTLDLQQFRELIGSYSSQPPALIESDGRLLNYFPWGASVVALPFLAVIWTASKMTGEGLGEQFITTLPLFGLESLVASMIGAATVGLFFILLHLCTRTILTPVALSLVFAFGTGLMSTTTRNMWIQGPAILLVVICLIILVSLEQREGLSFVPRDYLFAIGLGLTIALAYATRPTLALLGLISLVVTWRRGRIRLVAPFVFSVVVGLLAVTAVNLFYFGAIRPPYFDSRLQLSGSFWNAAAANLVSPGRGLLVWTPIVGFGLAMTLMRWRETSTLLRLLFIWVVVHLFVISSFPHWWAGATVGPRLMLDVMPALFLLLLPVFAFVESSVWLRPKRLLSICLLVCAVWGVAVNVRAAQRMSVVLWNWPTPGIPSIEEDPSRVWDWRDPQFLR